MRVGRAVGLAVLLVLASAAPASAGLARTAAVDLARDRSFERAVEVAFSPDLVGYDSLTDIRRPQCRRTSPRRFKCRYWFTVENEAGAVLYSERGRVRVTRKRQRLRATARAWATRG